MSQPTPQPRGFSQAGTMFRLSGLLLVGAALWSLNDAVAPITRIGELLGKDYAREAGIDPSAKLVLLGTCLNQPNCQAWAESAFLRLFGEWHALLLLAAVVPLVVLPFLKNAAGVAKKDPGSAAWAKLEDLPAYRLKSENEEAPFAGYIGQLLEVEPNRKFARNIEPLFLGEEQWCQNTIVQGGVGSGKTTGWFQANGAVAAHLGHTLIVFDTKWPQSDSGMREMLGYWHKLERPVLLWRPFEEDSLRLPMDDDIFSFEEGLRFSDAVMPPPEFQEETGAHYKQTQRRVLAAQARVNTMRGGNLKDLLNIALMTLDSHKKWIEEIDEGPDQAQSVPELQKLKLIMQGALSRGEKDFMDGMAAIISALRVFFNDHVLRACTGGSEQETILLETAFRTPTLIYVAVNQEDMLDGSGTILLRLFFRRVVQAVLRVARTSKGGKLPHLATALMDEQPSYGRLNYLMRIAAMMRSYRFALVIGIQNNAQGRLVYGPEYWSAISENVIARRVVFPRGLSGDDARDISERIGFTTVEVQSASVSSGGGLLGGESRNTQSSTLKAQPLLPVEEFSTFGVGEAVIISSHHRPIRTAFTPITFPTLKNPRVKKGTENWVHRLYQQVMAGESRTLADVSNDLITAGAFSRLTDEQWQAKYQERQRPDSRAAKPRLMVPGGMDVIQQQFKAWATQLADQGASVTVRPIGSGGENIDIEIASMPQSLPSHDAFVKAGLLTRENQYNLRVSVQGRKSLSEEANLLQSVKDLMDLYPVWNYIRSNAQRIEGTPERAALPEEERPEALGTLTNQGEANEMLIVKGDVVRSIFGGPHTPAFEKKRGGKGDWSTVYFVPVTNANLIRQAKTTGIQKEDEREKKAEEQVKSSEPLEPGPLFTPKLPPTSGQFGMMEDL